MASSIAAARAALYDLLAAAEGLAGVQVVFGAPDAYERQEVVALLGFGPVDDEPAAIGQARHDERYRIETKLKVHNPAADLGITVETRAMALYNVVRAVIAANPTLSGSVVIARPSGSDTSPGPQSAEGGGFVMFVSCFTECVARIS